MVGPVVRKALVHSRCRRLDGPGFQQVQSRLGQMESLQKQAEEAQKALPKDKEMIAAKRRLFGPKQRR